MGTFAETIVDYVYRLPTKEKNLPFPVSDCRKQTEVSSFRLQQTNGNGRFPCGIPETWRYEVQENPILNLRGEDFDGNVSF
jgi:hypothetical protein